MSGACWIDHLTWPRLYGQLKPTTRTAVPRHCSWFVVCFAALQRYRSRSDTNFTKTETILLRSPTGTTAGNISIWGHKITICYGCIAWVTWLEWHKHGDLPLVIFRKLLTLPCLSSSHIQMAALGHTSTPFCFVVRQYLSFFPGQVRILRSRLMTSTHFFLGQASKQVRIVSISS